jgi:tripartite ATP-independent transporter DctM subunit
MDATAMIVLTGAIIFPVIATLGFDPVWFGVIIVMTVEPESIHPPVGMNVFVVKSVVKDVNFSMIFVGVIPFIITDIIRLAILIAFPILAVWLPSNMGEDFTTVTAEHAKAKRNLCMLSGEFSFLRSGRRSLAPTSFVVTQDANDRAKPDHDD